MIDFRLFLPLDTLQEVSDALAVNGHTTPTWHGYDFVGMLPCPCHTYIEPHSRTEMIVWHGCATLELEAADFDIWIPERDERLLSVLSAICNWLVDLHAERKQ